MVSLRRVPLVLALVALTTCGDDSGQQQVTLQLAATIDVGAVPTVMNGIKADGRNILIIHIDGARQGPIRVTTSRGSFPGGTQTVIIDGTSGDVALATCDARTNLACAGVNTISAIDGSFAFGTLSVTFVGFEVGCMANTDTNQDKRFGCADPDCDTQACVDPLFQAGTCRSLACVPSVCVPSGAEVCNNDKDDDCDRNIDCEQTSCEGQACKPGSPSFACRDGACTDVGTGYAVAVTPKRTRLPADGAATTTVTVKVTKMAAPQSQANVELTTDLGGFVNGAGTVTTLAVKTGADGTATVTFQASATAGTAKITAVLKDVPGVSQSAFITMPLLGSIKLSSVETEVMGVRFSGFSEQNRLTVLLLDNELKPYPDGLAVRFEHQQLSSSRISEPFAPDTATCLQATGCLGYIGQTASPVNMPDSTGMATVNIFSGTAAGPISVSVSATGGGVKQSLTIQNLFIVGAKASGSHISLACDHLSTPALTQQDCTNSFYGDRISCTVYLADRFNNVLGVATRAEFRSEAGSAGPPVVTKAFDPKKGTDQTKDLGFAENSISVTGYRLPTDVPPLGSEKSFAYDDGCGEKTHNPRDGLSSIMAAVQGEEGFVDLNGNGMYDAREPFIDTGEPFVDENDNNVRDGVEQFIDVNRNNVWDGPNGAWDSNAVVWAEARVLYLGKPVGRFVDPDGVEALPGQTTTPTFLVLSGNPGSSKDFAVFFSDVNFNPFQVGLDPVYSVTDLSNHVSAAFVAKPLAVPRGLGMTFTQQFCDTAPPTAPVTCAATCTSAPCYRVTKLFDIKYGAIGTVRITGAEDPGTDIVEAKAAYADVVGTATIMGKSQPQ